MFSEYFTLRALLARNTLTTNILHHIHPILTHTTNYWNLLICSDNNIVVETISYYIEVFDANPFINCPNFYFLIEIIRLKRFEKQLHLDINLHLKRFNLEVYTNCSVGTPKYNFCHYFYIMLVYYCCRQY